MTVHGATVEEVFDYEDVRAFRAVCLVTGAVCDAWAFPGAMLTATLIDEDHEDGSAIERALRYLGDPSLHEPGSLQRCDAVHVMEHDRAATESAKSPARAKAKGTP